MNEQVLNAQKQLEGTVILPVKFSRTIHNWRFRVMNTLIALLIGTDIFQTTGGVIHFTKRFVRIGEEKQLITLTLNEAKQSTLVATVNRTVDPLLREMIFISFGSCCHLSKNLSCNFLALLALARTNIIINFFFFAQC